MLPFVPVAVDSGLLGSLALLLVVIGGVLAVGLAVGLYLWLAD